MGLQINKDEMQSLVVDKDWEPEDGAEELDVTGRSDFYFVFGDRTDMAYIERQDYHSEPHRHSAEQINFVLEGKVWWFVEDAGYLLGPGDFHRVPANAVHWAKVDESPVRMVEAHSPPLIGDNISEDGVARPGVEGLFTAEESKTPKEISRNVDVENKSAYLESEERLETEYYDRENIKNS